MTKNRFRKRILDTLSQAASKRLRRGKPARKDQLQLGQGDLPERSLQHVRQRRMRSSNDVSRSVIARHCQGNHAGREPGQMTGAEPRAIDPGRKSARIVYLQMLQDGLTQRASGQPAIELLHGCPERPVSNPVRTARISGQRTFPPGNDLTSFAISDVAGAASAGHENRTGLSWEATGKRYAQVVTDPVATGQRQIGGHV